MGLHTVQYQVVGHTIYGKVSVDGSLQFHRVVAFSRLLESYPFSRDRIISEAHTDICPLVRGEVWAALLGVKVCGCDGVGVGEGVWV